MDLLSQIMDSMDKERPPATSQPDKIIHSTFFIHFIDNFIFNLQNHILFCVFTLLLNRLNSDKSIGLISIYLCIPEENQQRKQVVEKERLFINNYKLKVQNKIRAFLKDSEQAHLQFESEDKILRTIWFVFKSIYT